MDALLSRLTPEQFDEWRAAQELDNVVGLDKLYAVLSLLGAGLTHAWGVKTKPEDFIPQWQPCGARVDEDAPVSPNQQAAMVKMQAASLGWSK